MASEHSFDVVSEVDLAEVQNAFNMSIKQIGQRYDFKGKTTELLFSKGEKTVTATASDGYTLEQMLDIFKTALAKREVDLKVLEEVAEEAASGGGIRKRFILRDEMKSEECKKITKGIKESKIKVKAQIQGDSVRITGKSRDDLQEVQKLIKELDLDCPVRFTNYK